MSRLEAEEFLAQLRAGPQVLSERDRATLDRDGYIVLAGVLDVATVSAMRDAVAVLLTAARRDPTRKHGGTMHLDDVLDSGPAFDPALTSPALLAAVAYVLGADFRVSSMGFRGPRPGYGAQALHADDLPLAAGDPFRVATAIVPLVDFTDRNGPTRVVPGSHREPLHDAPPGPGRRHPRERLVTARAGSAIVFNGHLWHSGTRNAADERRDALQIVFRRRAEGTYGQNVADATLDRLGTAALLLR